MGPKPGGAVGGGSGGSRGGKSSKVPSQLLRGQKFEKSVLKKYKLVKNTKKIGKSIPDSLSKGRISEIKDVKYVYKSKQFRDYLGDGRPVDLYVPTRTKISKPLEKAIKRSGGRIIRVK